MKKMKKGDLYKTRLNRIVRKPVVEFIIDIMFTVVAFLPWLIEASFPALMNSFLILIVAVVWGAAFVAKVFVFQHTRINEKEFRKSEKALDLAIKTLKVQQKSDSYKVRSILQTTYGHVSEWHPINYDENVLIYDVHEQIRVILIQLRDAVLALIGQTDKELVTADLVYCYPDGDYNGRLPEPKVPIDKRPWRLITSGSSSNYDYEVHDFLSSTHSFFFKLDQDNCPFYNDKRGAGQYYIFSGKDQESGGRGSIVGLTICLKNDVPETVLVKAMLVISTYKFPLYKEDSSIEKEEFENLFKEKLLDASRSLLESELAQMYIRHMIRNGELNRKTGHIKRKKPLAWKRFMNP